MKSRFAENLKYYRKQNKMKQDDLAKKLNTSRQAISTYEQGKRACSIDTLLKIAELFAVSTDDLLIKDNTENK